MSDVEKSASKRKVRKDKEFVYEQWRKFLTINVVNEDINLTEREPITVTSEQLRTVFNNGYKFALHQTMKSMNLDATANEIAEDRILTSNTYETYRDHRNDSLLKRANTRHEEFESCVNRDVTEWANKTM